MSDILTLAEAIKAQTAAILEVGRQLTSVISDASGTQIAASSPRGEVEVEADKPKAEKPKATRAKADKPKPPEPEVEETDEGGEAASLRSFEECKALVFQVNKTLGRPAIEALLAKYGATGASSIKPADYDAFYDEATALLEPDEGDLG